MAKGKLAGKKLILLGERDGIPGPVMEACLKDSGAETVFSVTECFV
jgi:glycine reductase